MTLQGVELNATDGFGIADWGWRSPSLDFPSDANDSNGGFQSHSFTDGSELFEDLLGVDDLGDQEDHQSPSDLLTQSFISAIRDIPNPRKERSKRLKDAKLRVISEEDYDDPVQQKLILLLKQRAKAIFMSDERANEYLRWFFVPTFESSIDFASTVAFLGGNVDEVRLRMMSYLFRHWIVLNAPISEYVYPPEDLTSKSMYYAGQAAKDALKIVWAWPGICQSKYVLSMRKTKGYSEQLAIKTLEHMSEVKLILEQSENLYVMGHYGKLVDKNNPWK